MKLYANTHIDTSMYEYMEALSKQLDSPVDNNAVLIPATVGTGFIKYCFIEEGFCLRYYHFSLNADHEFEWLADSESNEPIFKLVFFLEDANDNKKTGDFKKGLRPYETGNSTILYSTDFTRTGKIKLSTLVNRMVFLFTKKWLQENFGEASDQILETVQLLTKKNQPTFIVEKMDRSHYILAHELTKELQQHRFPLIHIKTKALTLLNDFLNRIVSRGIQNINVDQTLYYPEMTKVETTLRQYFDKPMPNISKLASEFNLSSSTLKRHFKIVYGINIQTYYLTNKMAIGRSLIISKSKTISEIAYTLGYTKVNSFSKAFKKQYGILPKEVNINNSHL